MTMARDEFEYLVLGDRCETTLSQFKLRAACIIQTEQARANPDNALISFACDAIRLAREYGGFLSLDARYRRAFHAVADPSPPSQGEVSGGDEHEAG